MAGEGRRRRIAAGGASRRDVLALTAIIGFGWAAGGQRAIAQPASARPKEGDLLVSAENEIVLAPADVPFGGPPLLAWPMDAADKTVRKESRLNKILLLRLDPATLVGRYEGSLPTRQTGEFQRPGLQIVFSSDGRHYGFIGQRSGQSFAVVDSMSLFS